MTSIRFGRVRTDTERLGRSDKEKGVYVLRQVVGQPSRAGPIIWL